MKASTYGFEEITPGRVILVDRDGRVLADGARHWPSGEEALRKRERCCPDALTPTPGTALCRQLT